jgi:O-antigen/teichoic acid export membrane protein
MAWQPFFMRHFRDKSSPLLFGQTFIWFNGFSAILYMIVALFKEQIVALEVPVLGRTIIDSNYWGGLEIVPFLLLAYWFHGWYINFSSGVFIKEKTRVLYKITMLGATITIVANLLLIPHFGMTGSAIATLLSYGTMATVLGLYSKRIMEVPYRLPESFGFMGIIAALVFVEPSVSVWLDAGWLISKSLTLTTGIFVSILYLKVLTVRNDEF